MTRYSIQHRDRILVKSYGFLSFAKNLGWNINVKLRDKYKQRMLAAYQERLNYAEQSASNAFKKVAEITGDLIGNKTANKIIKTSLLRNNSETDSEAEET